MSATISKKPLDAVVPLHARDFGRFELLRLTLDRFWKGGTIHVIVRHEDVGSARALIGEDRRFNVVSENSLISGIISRLPERGWWTQQILKLEASRIVVGDFYLTLDADCLVVGDVSRDVLVRNGRGLVEYGKPNHRVSWYLESSRILGLPKTVPERNVSVTPFILHTATVSALIKRLEALACERNVLSWHFMLIYPGGWTEYTLYHLFAVSSGLWSAYHELDGSHLIGPSIWFKEDLEKWDPRKVFDPERKFFFVVIQSTTGIDPRRIVELLAPYLRP